MIPTPIYDAVVADHGDVLNSGTPDEGGRVPIMPTPLMDDVARHGTGPWDEARRKALGSATANLTHKPPRPRQPRQRTAAKTPRKR